MRSFEDLLHHIMMNETSHAGVAPASDVIIESLLREQVTADTNQITRLGDCCISMEPFEPGDTAISLPCGHSYKQEAIVQWLRMHNTCPGEPPLDCTIIIYPLSTLAHIPSCNGYVCIILVPLVPSLSSLPYLSFLPIFTYFFVSFDLCVLHVVMTVCRVPLPSLDGDDNYDGDNDGPPELN